MADLVGGRAAEPAAALPGTFAEYMPTVRSGQCRACGDPASCKANLRVVRPKPGGGVGVRGVGGPDVLASGSWALCERCAVKLFDQLARALK